MALKICRVIAKVFNIEYTDLFGAVQNRPSVHAMHAKHVAMYFVREHTKWPYRVIDLFFCVGEGGAQYAHVKVKHRRISDKYNCGISKIKVALKEALLELE